MQKWLKNRALMVVLAMIMTFLMANVAFAASDVAPKIVPNENAKVEIIEPGTRGLEPDLSVLSEVMANLSGGDILASRSMVIEVKRKNGSVQMNCYDLNAATKLAKLAEKAYPLYNLAEIADDLSQMSKLGMQKLSLVDEQVKVAWEQLTEKTQRKLRELRIDEVLGEIKTSQEHQEATELVAVISDYSSHQASRVAEAVKDFTGDAINLEEIEVAMLEKIATEVTRTKEYLALRDEIAPIMEATQKSANQGYWLIQEYTDTELEEMYKTLSGALRPYYESYIDELDNTRVMVPVASVEIIK